MRRNDESGRSSTQPCASVADAYSRSQVLCALRAIWEDFTGVDDTPFEAETRIVAHLEATGVWDDVDLAVLFRAIEEFFGFSCGDEWEALFGFNVAERSMEEWERDVARVLTFGRLADFIASRAPVIASFEPINMLGRECAPAGAFIGIRQVAAYALGPRVRFAPSSRVLDELCGADLDRFWSHLRWLSEDTIPELPAFWRTVTQYAGCTSVLAVLVAVAFSVSTGALWLLAVIPFAVALNLAAYLYKRRVNPLPPGVVTFRDLSLLIVRSRTGMPVAA